MNISLKQVERPTGYLFYDGLSEITRQPIIGIATLHTTNNKTGSMIQTWILNKDVDPLRSIKENLDRNICGDCPHKGNNDGTGRSCYVTEYTAPLGIYRAYHRNKYPKSASGWSKNKLIRMGAYGDPAAIPFDIWQEIIANSSGWTGYTHQWLNCDQRLKTLCMASVESRRTYLAAKALGWRTFRIRKSHNHPVYKHEFSCPASAEQNHRLTCETCLACCGTHKDNRKFAGDVSIVLHGNPIKMRNFLKRNP